MKKTQETRLKELMPQDEFAEIYREAVLSVEKDLALEDAGWINMTGTASDVISSASRITNLRLSRAYALTDPMGRQTIRIWTDYTFGKGMMWSADDERAKKALDAFWNSKDNHNILSARGQRISSDKLLIDGEVFFALFLGPTGKSKIRRIDPLEITEIITNADDKEQVMYYKREWADTQSKYHTSYYRSSTNLKDEGAADSTGNNITKNEDAVIYHLTFNTTTQRGNPLLLPALLWMKYLNKFIASRIAIMLALSRFATRTEVKGGQVSVDAIRAKTHDKEIKAGSNLIENLGAVTTVMKQETGARNAYDDARLIKLQIASAVGIPEQYFGDISIGNLATAKTVELPMAKMFQSYQSIWNDAYQNIDELILEHEKVNRVGKGGADNWYIDRDFPNIAPADIQQAAQAIVSILGVLPNLADSPDVQ